MVNAWQALEMIQNIRTAFNEILDENEWMDNDTKKVAKEKANAMNERIGYPDFLTNAMELSKEYHQVVLNLDYIHCTLKAHRNGVAVACIQICHCNKIVSREIW